MVFQEPLLFDTTVFENVASGLRLRGVAKGEIARRVAENLGRFRIAELAERSARTLSGGEAQRTSLARALAIEPEILLLDEPFAALDPISREALLEDLARTVRETGTTTVFVTHDRVEAERIADRIAVLESGRVRQVGDVDEVLRRPADAFVASFVGVENLLRVTLASAGLGGEGFAVLSGDGGHGEVDHATARELEFGGSAYGMKAGSDGLLCVRPEDVVLASADREPGANRLWGRVVSVLPQGPFFKVTVDCGVRVVAAVSGHVARELELRPGCVLAVELRPSDLYVLPRV
jgi:tungstate transport system ATP-binding protein